MNIKEIELIINCLSNERTLFYYFKDRYALMLLDYALEKEVKVSDLKKSIFARLLNKPVVKDVLKGVGDGKLHPSNFFYAWPDDLTYPFILTLDTWGGRGRYGSQTTRNDYNLVLQLNFSNKHDLAYQRLVKPTIKQRFNGKGHPVLQNSKRDLFYETLAWSRMDIDLDTSTALIEEVQSDWVRMALYAKNTIDSQISDSWKNQRLYDIDGRLEDVKHYVVNVLDPYVKLWEETVLAATIDFLRVELGIRHIYYHTAESGWQLKDIKWSKPPISLYKDLPEKFCFKRCVEAPTFLATNKTYQQRCKQMATQPSWYYLGL